MVEKKVTIIGSGNWGSAIARIVGFNVKANSGYFQPTVLMWVYEEVMHLPILLSYVVYYVIPIFISYYRLI